MCGIAGIVGLKDSQKTETCLKRMIARMNHRGPDAEGMWKDDKIALGHKRLSIIDLSTAANQPLMSKRHVLIFNGEIYNYKDIRVLLEHKYPFKTQSDTEVILYAYQEWGVKCLEYFNGMFALAIWDKEKKELFVARDRLGIKPLYYSVQGDTFIFASEIKSILASNLTTRKIDPLFLVDYLRYQTVHAPNTILQGIKQLKPGQYAIFAKGELRIHDFWLLQNIQSLGDESYSEVKKNIRNHFFEAVEKRLISDVPLGAFLSGGIDSSAIVAAMASVSHNKIQTFSIGFMEKEFDESEHAQVIANKFDTDHTLLKLSADEFRNKLEAIIPMFDVPSGDGANTYIVSQMVKEAGITVALSGLGGDEIFAGYDSFVRYSKAQKFSFLWNLPVKLRMSIVPVIKNLGNPIQIEKFATILNLPSFSFSNVFPISRRLWSSTMMEKMTHGLNINEDIFSTQLSALENEFQNLPTLSKVSIGEIVGYTQNVLLRDTDQMSMAHGLEVRVPFFDHNLVEYALSIPDKYKYPTSPKKLLVDSMGDLLPNSIVHRKKMGFSFPWKNWMQNELRSFCESNIENLSVIPYFNMIEIKNWWNQFLKNDQSVLWSQIWILVVLGAWIRNNDIEG